MTIENCKLETIPPRSFVVLTNLETLSIRTHAATLPLALDYEAFVGLENLRHVDLAQNNIEAIPDNLFCPIKTSFTLNLRENRLKSDKLGSCKLNITKLDVSYNEIKTISQNFLGHLTSLTEFKARQNRIEAVDKLAFGGLAGLASVDLSHNRCVY